MDPLRLLGNPNFSSGWLASCGTRALPHLLGVLASAREPDFIPWYFDERQWTIEHLARCTGVALKDVENDDGGA